VEKSGENVDMKENKTKDELKMLKEEEQIIEEELGEI
jgi:hypothetical protein